jgi:hypothetical protein
MSGDPTNIDCQKARGPWASPKHEILARHEHGPNMMSLGLGRHEHDDGLCCATSTQCRPSPTRNRAHVLSRWPMAQVAQ